MNHCDKGAKWQILSYDIGNCSHYKSICTCTFHEYFIHAKTTTKQNKGLSLVAKISWRPWLEMVVINVEFLPSPVKES